MFIFEKLEIPDLLLVKPEAFGDNRGYFMESYKQSVFIEQGIGNFVQDNQSKSAKNIFRGLHYQLNPKAQGKLVRVLNGAIIDFAVDIRKGSPYYGKWVSAELSSDNKNMLWVPEGFAHGFLSLEDETIVFYKTTNEYAKEQDRGILWSDPDIAIKLPVPEPILSEKDLNLPLLKDAENNFLY